MSRPYDAHDEALNRKIMNDAFDAILCSELRPSVSVTSVAAQFGLLFAGMKVRYPYLSDDARAIVASNLVIAART